MYQIACIVQSSTVEPRAWSGIGFDEEDEPESEPQAGALGGWMSGDGDGDGGGAIAGGAGGGADQRSSNDLLEMAPWCAVTFIPVLVSPFCSFLTHDLVGIL